MGNQLTGEAPSAIYPVEHYLNDIPNYEFDCGLGSTRFFKVGRARCKEGLVVVRVFVIHDPSIPLPLKEHQDRLDVIYKNLKNLPNCLPFQKHVKLDRAAILIRQYTKYSLHYRVSTRPFLTDIEKKWIAFQLLCALNQCHKVQICHGDIKAENVLLTGWNWLLLSDFASFKPTSIPFDNPADYSYFFDTSRRRVCYIAPERFTGRPPVESGDGSSPESTKDQKVYKELTPAMDIFSAGCVIIEMFLDNQQVPFDLSQLLGYSCKKYTPWKLIDSIPDNNIKELVGHMIQLNPEMRLSAEEYLIKQRGKAFPEYFYTFFKIYSLQFVTGPIMASDDRILMLSRDMDHILTCIHADVNHPEKNPDVVLVINLVTNVCRDLHFSSFRLVALKLLTRLAKYVTAEIILDRIIPYVLEFSKDVLPEVRAETIRSVTACVRGLNSVPPHDRNIFQDVIIPDLSELLNDSVLQVRITFAENIAELATIAVKFLDMAHANEIRDVIVQIKDQQRDKSSISETVHAVKKSADELKPEIHQVETNYDTDLEALQGLIQKDIMQLLSDPSHAVKMTLMTHGMSKLCLFFGREKANDILLSHIVTFLNVKDDWQLRACFFKTVIDVMMYVGWQSSSVLLPLLQQGLSDTEEFVISEDLHALKHLTHFRLLNKESMQILVCDAAPLLAHPGPWIRQAAVGFICAVAKAYNIPDIFCKLAPQVRPFLTRTIAQLRKPAVVLDGLAEPIPRDVFDYLLRSTQLDQVFVVINARLNARNQSSSGRRNAFPEVDENVAQVVRKLKSLGMTEEFEKKLLRMKDFILKLHKSRSGSVEATQKNAPKSTPGSINIIHHRNIPRRHADLHRQRDPVADAQNAAKSRKLKKQESMQMNPEWQKMFGKEETDSDPSSATPRSSVTPDKMPGEVNLRNPMSATNFLPGSPGGASGGHDPMALTSESFQRALSMNPALDKPQKSVMTRYAKCKWELRDLVHHKRAEFEHDLIVSMNSLTMSGDERCSSGPWHRPPDSWKPRGVLVAHLQEHRGAVNRLCLSPDHKFFGSCSNDGTVRIWESGKLEGKTAANRSRVCLNKQGGRIKCVTFLQGTGSIASASDNNTIHVYKLDKGTVQLDDARSVDKEKFGQIMDMVHFDTGVQGILTYATVSGHIIGWDKRCTTAAWTLESNPRHGLLTSVAVHPNHQWMSVGTHNGRLIVWDLRYQMAVNNIQHPSGRRVKRLMHHPTEDSWMVASFNWCNEISMWDAETGQRQKTLWPSSSPPLCYNKTKPEIDECVAGMCIGQTESKTVMLTGGTDRRLRFWDLSYPASSHCFSYGLDDPHKISLSYRSQLMEGSEVVQELETQRETAGDRDRDGSSQHLLMSSPIQGHTDTISDLALCHTSQTLVVSACRNGTIKVWK